LNRRGNHGMAITLRTARLVLRPWTEADHPPFAALCAEPRVMRHFPKTLTPKESGELAARIRAHFEEHGFGLWAVEVPGTAPFIGYVGLTHVAFEAHFTPAVEVGWRLAAEHWGRGYATEGARAALQHAFGPLGLREVVSFTVPANERSWRVMERIGMTRSPADDFDHPRLPEGHALRRHVLYRARPVTGR
jgi:RimJ/RimL family protein N-acetyltransferase